MNADHRRIHDATIKVLVDEGRLIEAGFFGLWKSAIAPDAPQVQINEMRMAFMAGAQHLFASIMTMLDPGIEPTERDFRRMDQIHKELERYSKELELRVADAGSKQ
jgi:hypothetical protein